MLDYRRARPEENRFTKVVLAEKLNEPVELAVLPDERVLFIERRGAIRLYAPRDGRVRQIGSLAVSNHYTDGDMGEDGLAVSYLRSAKVALLDDSGDGEGSMEPAVNGKELLLEAHVFDFDGDLYRQHLHVDFIAFLREERWFADLDALRAQMDRDAAEARERVGEMSPVLKTFGSADQGHQDLECGGQRVADALQVDPIVLLTSAETR